MNLTDLVKSKFLPPLSNHYSTPGRFLIKKIEEKFVPCMESHRTYHIYKDGPQTSANSDTSHRTFLSSAEEAIKMCWEFFDKNRDHINPRLNHET